MYDTLLLKYFGVSQLINMCCKSHLCVCVLSCTSSVQTVQFSSGSGVLGLNLNLHNEVRFMFEQCSTSKNG
jgi:hypothetical protein